MSKYVFLLMVLAGCAGRAAGPTAGHDRDRFLIVEGGLLGYIDRTGAIVIEPQYRSADDFAEGLAPVRLEGSYGYIDPDGKMVIEPQFDYATPFSEGLALVYMAGKPEYINPKGEQVLRTNYRMARPFYHGLAAVSTQAHNWGLIDKSGRLVVDTSYEHVGGISEGRLVVSRKQPGSGEEGHTEYAVLDTSGRELVPFGRYHEMGEFRNGYARVGIVVPGDSLGEQEGFIDLNGKPLFLRHFPKGVSLPYDAVVSDGLTTVELYRNWKTSPPAEDDLSMEESYTGFIDTSGRIVLDNPDFKEAKPFHHGLTLVENRAGDWVIIDRKGRQRQKVSFQDVEGNGFINGVALVKAGDLWGLIDTAGRYLIKPSFWSVEADGLEQGVFRFTEYVTIEGKEEFRQGLANTTGKRLTGSDLDFISWEMFVNGLVRAKRNDRLVYLDRSGKTVWEETPAPASNTVNVDYKMRGYCYAFGSPAKESGTLSHSAGNNAYVWAKPIQKGQGFPANQLAMVARPAEKARFNGKYEGLRLYLANTTRDTLAMDAQDARLYIKLQARDRDGQWKDIEYLPSSWCGNSYHTVALKPNEYWAFTLPAYQGAFKTRLRAELRMREQDRSGVVVTTYSAGMPPPPPAPREPKTVLVHSNEFEGSVNPGQFWREPDYFPSGIMDPYFN